LGDEWEDRNIVKEFLEKPDEAFPGKGHQTPEAEHISQLKRENERLRIREIHRESRGTFGILRVRRELREEGVH